MQEHRRNATKFVSCKAGETKLLQPDLNNSNIFGTIENCSRHGLFESLKFNHSARSGSK